MQKMEKVILKSLLKETTLAKYLKGIENHQLNVELPSGKVHFRKLEFNAEEINKLLNGSGWKVDQGSVDEAFLHIPWQKILESGCSVKLKNIRLQVSYKKETEEVASSSSTLESSISWGMGSSLLFGGENLANSQFLRSSMNLQEEEVAAVGLDVLAKTIEQIFSKVEATIEDLVLTVHFYSKSLDKWIVAVLTFPFLEYVNAESQSDSTQPKSFPIAKVLRVRNFEIELGEMDADGETSLETVISGNPTNTGETLQIRFQQKQSEGLPRQVEGTLGNIGVRLTPKTCELLLAILESESRASSSSPTQTTEKTTHSAPQPIGKSSGRFREDNFRTPPQSPSGNSVPELESSGFVSGDDDSDEEFLDAESEFQDCEDHIYQGMLRIPSLYVSLEGEATTLAISMKDVLGSYQQTTLQTMIKLAANDVVVLENREDKQEPILSFVTIEKYVLPADELRGVTSPLHLKRQTQGNVELCIRYSQKDPLAVDREYLLLLDETRIVWDAYFLQRLEKLITEFSPSSSRPEGAGPHTPQLSSDSNDLGESTTIVDQRHTRTILNVKIHPSILITTRFPDLRAGAKPGALRDEVLLIDIFQPKLQSVLFSDQTSTSIVVDFDQLRATLKRHDEGYRPPIFEAQTKNTRDEVNSPIEITINSPSALRTATLSMTGPLPNPSEPEHFRFYAMSTAKTSIRLVLPYSELTVTKNEWDLLNELLDVMVLPSEEKKDEKQKLLERRKEKEEDTEDECPSEEEEEEEEVESIGPSSLALSIFFTQGKWFFKENRANDPSEQRFVYVVDYQDLTHFTVYQYLGRSLNHTIITMMEASINEAQQSSTNDSTLVVHRNSYSRPTRERHPVFLALIQKTPCDKSARLSFSDVVFEVTPTSTYASRLVKFFGDSDTPSESPSSLSSSSLTSSASTSPPPKKSNYFIVLNDATLRYQVSSDLEHHDYTAIVALPSFDALIPIEPNTPFQTQLAARDAVLLLGKAGTVQKEVPKPDEGEFLDPYGSSPGSQFGKQFAPPSLERFWQSLGFRDVVHFGPVLEVAIKSRSSELQPETQVSITNHLNPLEISVCSDGIAAIHELIQSFSAQPIKKDDDFELRPRSGSKPVPVPEVPQVEESFPLPPGFNLFSVIDRKAFEKPPPSTTGSFVGKLASVFYSSAPPTVSSTTAPTSTSTSQTIVVQDLNPDDEGPVEFGAPSVFPRAPAADDVKIQRNLPEKKEKARVDEFVMVTSEPTVRRLVDATSMEDFIKDDYKEESGDPEENLQLPKGYPVSVTRFVVRDFSMAIKLLYGKEWPTIESTPQPQPQKEKEEGDESTELERSESTADLDSQYLKDPDRCMRVDLEKIDTQIDFFGKQETNKWRFSLLVNEVKVEDNLQMQPQTDEPHVYWLSFDDQYSRDKSSDVMLRIELDCVRPDRDCLPHREEYRLKLSVLPLHFHGSQDSVDFLKQFVKDVKALTSPSTPDAARQQPQQPPAAPSSSESQMFFQTCSIKSLRVRADYEPTQFVPSNLLYDYGELLNAFVLEGAVINLNHLKLQAINGWGALFNAMQRIWLSQIINIQQMYDVVAGVKRVRPIMVLGGAAADMVRQVIEQYRHDGRVLLALQRGGSSFYSTLVNQVGGMGIVNAATTYLGGWMSGSSPSADSSTGGSGSSFTSIADPYDDD